MAQSEPPKAFFSYVRQVDDHDVGRLSRLRERHKNSYQAVFVHKNGRGTFEDNDLRDNARGPWNIAPECLPNVKQSGNIEN
jgi:hypothetical protein